MGSRANPDVQVVHTFPTNEKVVRLHVDLPFPGEILQKVESFLAAGSWEEAWEFLSKVCPEAGPFLDVFFAPHRARQYHMTELSA